MLQEARAKEPTVTVTLLNHRLPTLDHRSRISGLLAAAGLAPFIGATGAATFLLDYRIPFMVTGIGINAVGVIVAARRLRRTPLPATHGGHRWAHA